VGSLRARIASGRRLTRVAVWSTLSCVMNSCVRAALRRLAALVFALGLSAGTLAAQASGFVHTQGENIVDGTGHPILLRGINLGNWFEVEGYMFHFDDGPQSPHEIENLTRELIGPEQADAFWIRWRQAYITQADIDRIAGLGFNSVRVPLHYKFFIEDGSEGFRLIDQLVAWAARDHIYVILDLHCAPGGQTGSNIDDSDGYPWLYGDQAAQASTIEVWRRIAAHYANNPTVLGYDLLNEPIPNWPRDEQFNPDLEPVYKKIAAAIRAVDPNHTLILGGAQWDSNFSVFGPPFDKNVVYQLHKYWMKTTDVSTIQPYLDFRARYHVPIWCGESGENNDAWIAGFRQTLEANNVGWAFWTYKRMDTTSSVVSFDRPAHWEEIVQFAKLPPGTGNAEKRLAARPPQADIAAAFADLLEKIQFTSEKVNAGYVQALGLKQR
jgi:endoglucanase